MTTDRLERIQYLIPANYSEEEGFFIALWQLICGAANAKRVGEKIMLASPDLPGLLPTTGITPIPGIRFPQVRLATDRVIDLQAGQFFVKSTAVSPQTEFEDELRFPPRRNLTAMGTLVNAFASHVRRVNHTGIDLPSRQVKRKAWDGLVRDLSQITHMYAYPGGTDSRYIVPAAEAEAGGEIRDLSASRAPLFKLDYGVEKEPVMLFDLATDLPRAKVEAALPVPLGSMLGDNAPYRTCYALSPWPTVLVRFDIRWAREGGEPWGRGWHTGEFLVKQSRRVRQV